MTAPQQTSSFLLEISETIEKDRGNAIDKTLAEMKAR
jgi:hypothetical protein